MILSFSVTNFKSINQRVHLSMVPASRISRYNSHLEHFADKGKDKSALSSAIIFGKNACGKSNFLLAMQTMKEMVLNSDLFNPEQNIYFYEPFVLETKSLSAPTIFEIDFVSKQNIRFRYSFSYTDNEIMHEQLHFYPKNVIAKLFIREKGKPISFGENFKGEKRQIEKNLRNNQLLLSKATSCNNNYLSDAFLFFELLTPVILTHHISEQHIKELFTDIIFKSSIPFFKENLNYFLNSSDPGIIDFQITENDKNVYFDIFGNQSFDKRPGFSEYTIKTLHKYYENGIEKGFKSFALEYESQGTQKLFVLASIILVNIVVGGVVIIDELDKSIHSLLSRMLVEIFHSKQNNPNGAQLIFTTHDSTLLNSDLFRRDQVCLVEKQADGSTSLTKLSDIKGVRKDIPFDKWYLSTRFSSFAHMHDFQLRFGNPLDN